MNKISIIGCGWLGLSLGAALARDGYPVIGSTTTKEKLSELNTAEIEPVYFKLSPMPEGDSFQRLFQSEDLFINIPPQSRSKPPEHYREQIKYLKYLLHQNESVKRVIFISSTSYYPNMDAEVNESTAYDFEQGSNKAIVWAEEEIKKIDQKLIILRLGGLFGGDRIPGRYASNKETTGKDNPTNYIHREDVIDEVKKLLSQDEWPNIKNLVHPAHYSRQKISETMSSKHQFEPPKWIKPFRTPTKKVCSIYPLEGLMEPLNY